MPTFCIGIPTHNRPDDLAICLDALVPQIRRRANARLVVVNDGTHDERYERVVAQHRDAIDYRIQTENRGSGPTRAAAFSDATEDYLVCTDDDCRPPDDWLDMLEAIVETNPEADLVAGAVEPVWTATPTLWNRMLAAPASYPGPHLGESYLLTAVTANCAYRRQAYEAAGRFHPELSGAAADDFYMTQQLRRQGATGLLAENWKTGHKSHQTIAEIRRRFRGYGFGNARLICMLDAWEFAELMSDGSLAGSLRKARQWVASDWRRSGKADDPLPLRIAHWLVTLMLTLEHERGWRRGLRHFAGTDFRSTMPRRPPLRERFVDFADPAQRQTALGN